MHWPSSIAGHPRTVKLERVKCYSCPALTGSYYGSFPYCIRCANLDSVAEQYAKPQAVAR